MFCQIFDSMLNPVFDLENKAKVKGNPNNKCLWANEFSHVLALL